MTGPQIKAKNCALSPREREVAIAAGTGESRVDTAKRLGIAVKTVACTKQNARNKLGLASSRQLGEYARMQGVVLMTRAFVADDICIAEDCQLLGLYHLGAKIVYDMPAPGVDDHYLVETPLVVCDEHKANPPETCPAFFKPESRVEISRAMSVSGGPKLNFGTAIWTYELIATPPKAGAN